MPQDEKPISEFPIRLELPLEVDETTRELTLWTGDSELRQGTKKRTGVAKIFIQMEPRPDICFHFSTIAKPSMRDFFAAMADADLSDCEIDSGEHIGTIQGSVSLDRLVETSGDVHSQAIDSDRYTAARFLVVNGPELNGNPYSRKRGGVYRGRNTVTIEEVVITVDQLSSECFKNRQPYRFTHIAEIRSKRPMLSTKIEQYADKLFLSLSLAEGRWSGLIGAWLYEEDQFLRFCPYSTKVSPLGSSPAWLHKDISGGFEEIVKKLQHSYREEQKAEVLQTVIHWLIESSLCAGGVEGSLVLMQAAFEALAWFEIVHNRRLCSVAGFTNLPAVDKMRWFASSHSISATVPAHCRSIMDYTKAFDEVNDLLDMLVDIRNGLVHSSPNKMKRILRPSGSEERTELWFQIVFLLLQAVLATIDYRGDIIWSNRVANFIHDAIGPVPWIQTKKPAV